MKVADSIARALLDEGVRHLACYPRNPLIDPCAAAGIRPIIPRSERTGVHIADGISRTSNGAEIGVFACQGGPGIENAFAGVAQSFGDNTPILVFAGPPSSGRSHTPPTFSAVANFAHVTAWACELDRPERTFEILRRAFHTLRSGKAGPVLIELGRGVAEADCGAYAYTPVAPLRSLPDLDAVARVADLLLEAERPVIHAGAGVLWGAATDELVELADLLQLPVLTTNTGKSGFPEDHPLALGAMVVAAPAAAFAFLERADLIFGVGTSFSRTVWGPQIPPGRRMVHLTNCAADINKEYPTEAALLGDVKLALRALIAAIGARRRAANDVAGEIATIRKAWRESWAAHASAGGSPIDPYRVVAELQTIVDPRETIVTHDAGTPREITVPFWTSTVPRSYLGWGKSTSLGSGLGLILGAKVAAPDKLCINFMGDASIGMVGMDLETAARCKLGILTIVFNNGLMEGERQSIPVAAERYDALDLGGDYATVARGLGLWSKRVERAEAFGDAAREAIAVTREGRPALIEIMARRTTDFSRP
jgi:thiamine pyrophosphate-dependent acetolactate synthase large subunit-like protein